MTDQRLLPANGRVAAVSLKGKVVADQYVEGTPQSVTVSVVDLCAEPKGLRKRQLLLGATVTLLELADGWGFVQAADGYVGYVQEAALGDLTHPTHFVATPATHGYAEESFKSRDTIALPFGAKVVVTDERQKYFETQFGFIPKKHLRPLDQTFNDPATIAQMHYGVPYLWGGNSTRGIDCSGLVAAALTGSGIACPADSDMQQDVLGHGIADNDTLKRGDLLFWDGHVGMMVDADTLIHANAHHVATVYEPVERAILRIKAQGDGDVTARKRL